MKHDKIINLIFSFRISCFYKKSLIHFKSSHKSINKFLSCQLSESFKFFNSSLSSRVQVQSHLEEDLNIRAKTNRKIMPRLKRSMECSKNNSGTTYQKLNLPKTFFLRPLSV